MGLFDWLTGRGGDETDELVEYANGVTQYSSADGVLTTEPDGTRTYSTAEGVSVTHPDGTVVWQSAAGNILVERPDGSELFASRDGVSITLADGTEFDLPAGSLAGYGGGGGKDWG